MDTLSQAATQESPCSSSQGEGSMPESTWGILTATDSSFFYLTNSPFTIGRLKKCDIYLDKPYVSKIHCVLTRDADDTCYCEDQSTNGMFIVKGDKLERLKKTKVIITNNTKILLIKKQDTIGNNLFFKKRKKEMKMINSTFQRK